MIQVKHSGVTIEYEELRDKWEVDDSVNGITLSRKTLADARRAVDAAMKKTGRGGSNGSRRGITPVGGRTQNIVGY
jgi:hypothetical protein